MIEMAMIGMVAGIILMIVALTIGLGRVERKIDKLLELFEDDK